MTLASAMLRASYLRTLRTYVGPLMGWRVRNADNDLRAPSSLVEARKGGGFLPDPSPTSFRQAIHAAPNTGKCA